MAQKFWTSTLVFFLAIAIISSAVNRYFSLGQPNTILDLLMIVLLLGALFLHQGFRSLIINIPIPHKLFLGSFFFLFFLGHLTHLYQTTFPFISWRMYSSLIDTTDVQFLEYNGIDSQGRRVNLKPHPYLTYGFVRRVYALLAQKDSQEQVREVFKTFGKVHNQTRATPIVAIEARIGTIRLNDNPNGRTTYINIGRFNLKLEDGP